MDLPHFLMGLGSAFAAVKAFQSAFTPPAGRSSLRGLGDQPVGLPSSRENVRAQIQQVFTIDQRLAGVMTQINKSVRDPYVRMVAAQIVSRRCREPNARTGDGGWCIDEKDYWGEVRAVFNWVRANVRYVRDIHRIDLFQQARRTIQTRSGDCDDYNILIAALLMTIGYPVRSKTIQTKDSEDWNHIYLQVGLPPGNPRVWKTLDASVPRPAGWEAPSSIIKRSRLDYPTDSRWARAA